MSTSLAIWINVDGKMHILTLNWLQPDSGVTGHLLSAEKK